MSERSSRRTARHSQPCQVRTQNNERHSDFVAEETAGSAPGRYRVWRESAADVVVVEVQLDAQDRPLAFPTHLLDEGLLGSMTIWPSRELQSFVWWHPSA